VLVQGRIDRHQRLLGGHRPSQVDECPGRRGDQQTVELADVVVR
jgi:hypothetical protein